MEGKILCLFSLKRERFGMRAGLAPKKLMNRKPVFSVPQNTRINHYDTKNACNYKEF
jgi:hypothetical protein